jgi:hypothetical protein
LLDWFACQLEETDEFIIAQPIEGDMNTRWSQEALAFMWNFSASHMEAMLLRL